MLRPLLTLFFELDCFQDFEKILKRHLSGLYFAFDQNKIKAEKVLVIKYFKNRHQNQLVSVNLRRQKKNTIHSFLLVFFRVNPSVLLPRVKLPSKLFPRYWNEIVQKVVGFFPDLLAFFSSIRIISVLALLNGDKFSNNF